MDTTELLPLGRSPSREALASLNLVARRERRPQSAPATPGTRPFGFAAAVDFIEKEHSDCGRVVRGERLLQRAIKSPQLLGSHVDCAQLQRTLQDHLLAAVPTFGEALALARQVLTPVRLLAQPAMWQIWGERESRAQLVARGLAEEAGFADTLTARLRALNHALPGSQAGAMLLWQRFDARELLVLAGRPQRAWFASTARYVKREGLYRTALELRLYFEGDATGCPHLVQDAPEPLSAAQRKQLMWLVPNNYAKELLDLTYPGREPVLAHQRDQLLSHVEHWLYDIASSVPKPVDGDGLRQGRSDEQGAPAAVGDNAPGYRRSSVNLAAQHRYFDSQVNRDLERRLDACERELLRRWTPIFKEGVRNIVSELVDELVLRQASPATLRGD